MGQSVPSADSQMSQYWEEQLTHQKVCSHSEVPDRLVKWEKGISLNSTKGSGEEQNTLRASYFGSSLTEKYLEGLVDSKLNKPVRCPCGKKGQQSLRMCQECSQQAEGDGPSPLLSTESHLECCVPVLSCPAQETCGNAGDSPGSQKWWRDWETFHLKRGWENWDCLD